MDFFKFKRVKNKFRWESDFMVLEFSNPSIQGFSDYIKLTNEKGIMYYYYTVKIFKKVTNLDNNENEIIKWKLVSDNQTYDFPCILELKWMLDYQLKDNTIVDGQKIKYNNGDIRYSKTVETEGFACDDFYEITKSVNSEGKNDSYVVYCGTTFDSQGDLNSSGIRTPYVSRKDIGELLNCVSSFIQYSLDKHNKSNIILKDRYEIKNNKIYEYSCDKNIINKTKIEAIFATNDTVNITTVSNNEEHNYDNVKIIEIGHVGIVLTDDIIIPFNSIVYISNEVSDTMLYYTESDIAKEFVNILSKEEMKEFIEKPIDFLLNKYKMAIIERTWMCRDEHSFNMDYNGDRVETVTPVVINVINMIKKEINNRNNSN